MWHATSASKKPRKTTMCLRAYRKTVYTAPTPTISRRRQRRSLLTVAQNGWKGAEGSRQRATSLRSGYAYAAATRTTAVIV